MLYVSYSFILKKSKKKIKMIQLRNLAIHKERNTSDNKEMK